METPLYPIAANANSAVPHSREREGKWNGRFVVSAAVILSVTGIAKVISVFGESPVLRKPDPILGMHFDHLLLAVGLVELAIALFCFTSAKRNLAVVLVAALSINFLVYRLGLWFIGWNGYCPCLGTLTEAIHLSPRYADILMRTAFFYLITGSFYFLGRVVWANWKARGGSASEQPDSFSHSSG